MEREVTGFPVSVARQGNTKDAARSRGGDAEYARKSTDLETGARKAESSRDFGKAKNWTSTATKEKSFQQSSGVSRWFQRTVLNADRPAWPNEKKQGGPGVRVRVSESGVPKGAA